MKLYIIVIVSLIAFLCIFYSVFFALADRSVRRKKERLINNPNVHSISATLLKTTPAPPPNPHVVTPSRWDTALFQLDDGTRIGFELSSTSYMLPGDHGILTYEDTPSGWVFVSFKPDTSPVKVPDSSLEPSSPVPATIIRLSSIDSKALFEFEDGGRVNLVVPPSTFALLREGMRGQLSYQGDTFQLFTPDASPSSPSF